MSAGELCDHFPVSRPTMSAHFAVLREADLIESRKIGTTIIYQIKLSVLEDAFLGFAQLLGIGLGEGKSKQAVMEPSGSSHRKTSKGKTK